MTARSPSAFFLSATLHALFAAALFYTAYALKDEVIDKGKIFELVAGEGDNFAATEAPALGTPGGVKFDLASAPAAAPVFTPPKPVETALPEPVAPAPVEAVAPPKVEPKPQPKPKPEPSPITKVETKPDAKTDPVVPNLVKSMKRVQVRIDSKQKAQRAKEEKEAKRQADLAAKAAEIAARKAELTGQGKAGGGQSKIAKIDAEGIAKGVIGGSTANKTGGAGGKALSREEQDLLGTYFALLKQRLREAHEKPVNGGDKLAATAEFHVSPAGTLSQVRIVKSSGDAEFDQSVLDAFHKVSSIRRQDEQGELVREVTFRMKDED
jgi:colicin import membrane protein